MKPVTKDVFRFILFLVSVGIISLLFPRHQKIDVNCKVGEVWEQENYNAPFDFDIQMPESELTAIKEDVQLKFPLVMEATTVHVEGISKEIIASNDSLVKNEALITETIKSLYKDPIISSRIADGDADVILFNDQVKINVKASKLITTEQLENLIFKSLRSKNIRLDKDQMNSWNHKIVPNYAIDNTRRNKLINEEVSKTNTVLDQVKKGQTILRKGEIVTTNNANAISALKKAAQSVKPTEKYAYVIRFIGYFLLTILIIGVLVLYVKKYFPQIYDSYSGFTFVLFWPVVFSLLVFFVESSLVVNSYLIPFCIVPIVIQNFYSGRLALFVHIVVILIASYLSKQGYDFTFLQIFAGIVTVLIVSETRFFDKFFYGILFIFTSYMLGYLGLTLIDDLGLERSEMPVFMWLTFNSILLLLSYPLIPLVEKAFGFTSNITLAELSDMNNPLLKELSINATGTLQHSLQVANLSEAAADKIGANSLLVKTAALYHDIGKLSKPEFFIENSSGNNPHDALNDNFESAEIIINHISHGVEMAKKAKLPKKIIDFIRSHHGDSRVEYFYRKQLSSEPDREFDESLFRYQGPKPESKEETILMMADSLEAASKSLKNPTGQDIDLLVDNIINHKIENGQFENSKLTFKELEACINVFKSLLRSINHVRIEYPEEVKNQD